MGEDEGLAPRYGRFEHVADVGIRGQGPTLAVALEQVALALVSVVVDPMRVEERRAIAIDCVSESRDLLLYDFLDALIGTMAREKLVYRRVAVELDGLHLRATIHGERVDRLRHEPAAEPKGPTFTELSVVEVAEPRGFVVQAVVDV